MYFGLKKLGCKVVWSIKNFELPEENPNFHVGPWMPQIEVLAHPACKAGLGHCGFGATLEFTSMGIPIVAWPHFEDQHPNAEMLVNEKKVAVMLCNIKRHTSDLDKMYSYIDPAFDDNKVYEVFKEVTTNPIYKQNVMKMKEYVSLTGGSALACKTIEDVANHGSDHLVDVHLTKAWDSLSFCKCCWFFLVLIAI